MREIEREMKQKNERYSQRRATVMERKRFLEALHDHQSIISKKSIEQKFIATEKNKNQVLNQKCMTARDFNSKSDLKNLEFKTNTERMNNENYKMHLKQEENQKKKLRELRRSQENLLDTIKNIKKNKETKWYSNQKGNEHDYKSKLDKIMNKLKKSQLLVEENQRKFQHEMDLRNERRRLKEIDLKMERDRQRKLDNAKKERIIEKEEKNSKLIKSKSFKQTLIKAQLMEDRIRQLIHRDVLMSTIINVVHNNTSPKVRNKMLQKNNLNLNISMINLKTAQKDENE